MNLILVLYIYITLFAVLQILHELCDCVQEHACSYRFHMSRLAFQVWILEKKTQNFFFKKGQEYKFSTCTFYRKRAYFIFSNKIYVLASEWNNTFTMKIFIVWKQQTLVSYVVYCPTPFKIWRKPVLKSNKPKIQYLDVQCGIKIFNIILLIGLYVFVEINYIFNILFMSCMPLIRWTLNSTDKIVSSKKVN